MLTKRVIVVSRTVFETYGPGACARWESKIGTIWLVTQHSRNAPVTVKFGIKALSMIEILSFAMVFVARRTEEPRPETPKASAPAAATAKPGGGDMKPSTPAPAPSPEKKP